MLRKRTAHRHLITISIDFVYNRNFCFLCALCSKSNCLIIIFFVADSLQINAVQIGYQIEVWNFRFYFERFPFFYHLLCDIASIWTLNKEFILSYRPLIRHVFDHSSNGALNFALLNRFIHFSSGIEFSSSMPTIYVNERFLNICFSSLI